MRFFSRRAPAGRGLALVGVLALGGCADLAEGSDRIGDDNRQEQERLEPVDWSCLPIAEGGNGVVEDVERPIQYRIQLVSLFGGALGNVRARACRPIDIRCDSPLDEAVGTADGFVTMTLFYGFSGFLEISSAGMIPILFYPFDNLVGDTEYPRPLSLAPTGSLDTLADDGDVTFSTDRAHVTAQAFDCQLQRAPGIQFRHDRLDVGDTFYFASNVPSPRATQTDERGVGVILNLPPTGGVTVEAVRAGSLEVIGRRFVTLRPGWFTTVDLLPR